jgi:hypothetical protein
MFHGKQPASVQIANLDLFMRYMPAGKEINTLAAGIKRRRTTAAEFHGISLSISSAVRGLRQFALESKARAIEFTLRVST